MTNITNLILTTGGNIFQILTLNLDTGQQNILLTDDQMDTTPTTYDAIVEIKSDSQALLLPRLTSAQMHAMANPVPGMIMHNLDEDREYSYSATHGFITTGGVNTPSLTTTNGIIIWANDVGNEIIDSKVTIDPTTGNITLPQDAKIILSDNGFSYSVTSPALTSDVTVTLPVGGFGTVTSVDIGTDSTNIIVSGGPITTSGTLIVNLSPNLSGLSFIHTEALTAVGTVTAGAITVEGTLSAGTLEINGDINSTDDITGKTLNLLANDHILTFEGNIAQVSDITLIFPSNKGTVNQVLATDGNGNLDWVTHNVFIDTGVAATVGFDILNGTSGVTINTTAVTINSIINITRNMGAGMPPLVTTIGNLIVGSIIGSTSFTVYSTTANDFGNFNWLIINP